MKYRQTFAAVLATCLMGTAIGGPGAVAFAQQDPNLVQTVTDEETMVPSGTQHAFTAGHADLGVRLDGDFATGQLKMVLRDDSQETPVWRDLNDVVFVTPDEAKQTLPEDGTYDFTGAKGGQQAWVLPQSQQQGIPWLGWNTQSPQLIKNVNQGVTMEFLGHQGPGQLTMFLQAGGFAAPEQLWNSAEPTPQGIWVDSNTHTHANWVFTEPGVHLIKIRVKAADKNGQEKSVEQIIRFAVGGSSSEDVASGLNAEALKATWDDSSAASTAADSSGSNNGDASSGDSATGDKAAQSESAAAEATNAEQGMSNKSFRLMLIGLVAIVLLLVVAGVIFKRKADLLQDEAFDEDQ